MKVQELLIEVEPLRGDRWRVRVTPVGEIGRQDDVASVLTPALAGFPSWDTVLASMAPTSGYQISGQDLRTLGERIWTGLFGNSTLASYMQNRVRAARAAGRPLRYVLKLDEAHDPVLALLPIELARSRDPEAGERFEWRQAHEPAIRVVSELEAPPLRFTRGARLVIATAHDPKNPVPTIDDLAAHAKAVTRAAEECGFTVETVPEATPDALEAALHHGSDVLYLVAHGHADPDEFGVLALAGETLQGTALKRMLEDTHATGRPCRAVILCACSSASNRPGVRAETTGMAQELSRHAVEAAIGFRAPVEVGWALAFMERLFGDLATSGDLEAAFARTRAKMPENDPQWPLAAYYGRPLKVVEPASYSTSPGPIHSPQDPLSKNRPSANFTGRELEVARLLHLAAEPRSRRHSERRRAEYRG